MAHIYKSILLFLAFGPTLFGSDIPTLKSGFNILKPTTSELKRKLKSLPHQEKMKLYYLQTLEILPQIIIKNIPFPMIEKINFSVDDTDYIRSQKFLNLGLVIINGNLSFTKEKINRLTYVCFVNALHHLKQYENYISEEEKSDYYHSLAQIEIWTSYRYIYSSQFRSIKDKDYALKLVKEAQSFLEYSKILFLKNLPDQKEFSNHISELKKKINSFIDTLDQNILIQMSFDETTKISLTDYLNEDTISDHYFEIKKNKLKKAKKIFEIKKINETIAETALQKYSLLLDQKFMNYNLSTKEKQNIIKSQGFLVNLRQFRKLDLLPKEISDILNHSSMKKSIDFYKTYESKFLNRDFENFESALIAFVEEKIEKIEKDFVFASKLCKDIKRWNL